MPNKIKYSTTNIPYSLRKGNVAIGTEDVEYGPTDNNIIIPNIDVTSTRTFWWNGITPPTSGYTIYQVKSNGSSPSIMCAQDDTQMINYAKSFGGSNINTIGDALNHVTTGVTNTIVVNKDYPSVVTSGLTLLVDASYTPSYPLINSTWYDLSGNANDAAFFYGPTYNSGVGGHFTFNGSNQYMVASGNPVGLTSYTKMVWFYLDSLASNNNLISGFAGGHFMFFATQNKLYIGHSDWGNYTAFGSNATFSTGVWYNACVTFNTTDGFVLYVNGNQDNTYTAQKTQVSGDGSTELGSYGGGNLLNGRIAHAMVYNRTLSSSEVLSLYNNTKTRFL